jgi:hypothetical protein
MEDGLDGILRLTRSHAEARPKTGAAVLGFAVAAALRLF